MIRVPIYFQIAAEGGIGKTHTAITAFPKTFLVDTTSHGDGRFTAMKLFGDDFDDRYYHAKSLEDVIKKVDEVIESGKFATLCLDEYRGLRGLGQDWYLRKFKKSKVFPVSEWGIINAKVGGVVWKALDNGINVVVTSGFSSVYKDGEKTSERVSNSPPNASLDIDFRMMLVENDGGTDVDVHVVKNKFKSVKDRNRTMAFPLTWKDIKEEAKLVGFEYCE